MGIECTRLWRRGGEKARQRSTAQHGPGSEHREACEAEASADYFHSSALRASCPLVCSQSAAPGFASSRSVPRARPSVEARARFGRASDALE